MAGDNICLKVEITNVSQIKTALRDVPHMQGSKCTEHAYTHTHTHIYIYIIYIHRQHLKNMEWPYINLSVQ